MKLHTETEENYLKCILRFSMRGEEKVRTTTIANYLGTKPASVTDMLNKLSKKNKKEEIPLVDYTPYQGVSLTEAGRKVALKTLRKHRLWEVFLVDKLDFSWDNVHDVAEQLEHVDSVELIRALDKFLGYPKFDPHGDPIPTEAGELEIPNTTLLSEVPAGEKVVIASVVRSDPDFLQYLGKLGLAINTRLEVQEHLPFDESIQVKVEEKELIINGNVAQNLKVQMEA
ncbi:MAG: metal-dependent transcriptional regulator [Bacteroidota bacterium]